MWCSICPPGLWHSQHLQTEPSWHTRTASKLCWRDRREIRAKTCCRSQITPQKPGLSAARSFLVSGYLLLHCVLGDIHSLPKRAASNGNATLAPKMLTNPLCSSKQPWRGVQNLATPQLCRQTDTSPGTEHGYHFPSRVEQSPWARSCLCPQQLIARELGSLNHSGSSKGETGAGSKVFPSQPLRSSYTGASAPAIATAGPGWDGGDLPKDPLPSQGAAQAPGDTWARSSRGGCPFSPAS